MAENNTKQWQWSPDAQIVLSGKEFSDLFNASHMFLNGIGAPSDTIRIYESFKVLQGKLEEMINSGTATELSVPESIVPGAQIIDMANANNEI